MQLLLRRPEILQNEWFCRSSRTAPVEIRVTSNVFRDRLEVTAERRNNVP